MMGVMYKTIYFLINKPTKKFTSQFMHAQSFLKLIMTHFKTFSHFMTKFHIYKYRFLGYLCTNKFDGLKKKIE